MTRFLLAMCGLVLVGTTIGCQQTHYVRKQAVINPERRQFGWLPFGKADRSKSTDVVQVSSNEIEPVKRARNIVPNAPRDPKWSKWLDYLPKAPRIPLPRTDSHESDIAVLESVESTPQDGRELTPLSPANQSLSNRSIMR